MQTMILSLALALLLTSKEITGADCPNGFESHRGSCYFFSHGEETWIGAFDSCKLFGSMLVEVNNAEEDAYLINKTSSLGDHNSWWISLADKRIEGEFIWESSQHILAAGEYTNWASGEPNNHQNENCVKYAHSMNFLWQDTACDDNEHYICEIESDQIDVIG